MKMTTSTRKPNKPAQSGYRTLIMGLCALLAIVNLAACGSKDSSSGTTAIVPYGNGTVGGYGGCPTGCAAGAGVGGVIASGIGNWTFNGQPAAQLNLSFYQANGGAVAQGAMQILANFQACGIPAGNYTVTSATVTPFTGGAFSNMILTAQGPSGVGQLTISGGLSSDGRIQAQISGPGAQMPCIMY
jgi:hypothetical protein